MSETRGQHHTPQVYLRRFADGEKIRVYQRLPDTPGFREFETNIKNVAKQRDLYSINLSGGERDNSLDLTLQSLERALPTLLDAVELGHPLGPTDCINLRTIVAIQEMRSPEVIENVASVVEQVNEMSRELYRHHRPELSEGEIEDLLQQKFRGSVLRGPDAAEPHNVSITTVGAVMPDFAAHLQTLNATILTSVAQDFVTSDCPVAWHDAAQYPPHPFYGLNRASATIEVTMPLTRRKALLLTRKPLPENMDANKVVVRIFNSRTANNANLQTYAFPDQDKRVRLQQRIDILCPWGVLPLLVAVFDPNQAVAMLRRSKRRRNVHE